MQEFRSRRNDDSLNIDDLSKIEISANAKVSARDYVGRPSPDALLESVLVDENPQQTGVN